jgi:ligand-binding SRPBCC domain-containing protein
MRDRVEYALPFGPLGRVVRRLFAGRRLDEIFRFRARVIGEVFGS